MFQACAALTSLDLQYCNKLTGEAKETSHSQAHLTPIKSTLLTRTTLSLPVTVHHTTPALLCGLVVYVYVRLRARLCVCVYLCAEACPDLVALHSP